MAHGDHLGQSQQSRVTPVSFVNMANPTELVRIPREACQPCHLCIRNIDIAASVYIKSGKVGATRASASDFGILLYPGEFYDWGGSIPADSVITALSTVNGSLVAIEANWCVVSEHG